MIKGRGGSVKNAKPKAKKAVAKKAVAKKVVAKKASAKKGSVKGGLRDLQKIIDDPEGYARGVTVKRLVTILEKMSEFYYSGKEPLVDDDTFDIMVDVLRERDPDNAFLFQTGAPTASKEDVQLPFSMPSLDKIKPGEKSLKRWFDKYKGPYVLSDKLDGISAQIYKDSDGNVDMYSKKQTNVGTSKGYLLKYLVDKKVLDRLPNDTSVRGEIVISRKDFKKFEDSFANPRSVMAGLVNTDKIDTRLAEKAQFVAYAIIQPRYTFSDQMKKLQKWGFKVVWHQQLQHEDIEEVSEEDDDIEYDIDDEEETVDEKIFKIEERLKVLLKTRREEAEFDVDGIVLADDSKSYLYSDTNPKYAMAFKMNIATNMKDVEVEEVLWEPSMYYYLNPVVRIKPTKMSGGVTITYVTAHNAKFVQDNRIGKGTIIKIVRSGDVIPYIVDVVKPSKKPDMPKTKYMWNETGVDIIVVDPTEEIQRKINIKRNLHFFRKIGVKYLSEGLMTKMYDTGYETVVDIAVAANEKDEEPYDISGLGKKMVTKIYDQIDRAFERVKLPELMAGSLKFGRSMGSKKIREIVKMYPDILDYYDDDVDDIKDIVLDVEGFSEILATKFAENLKVFYKFLTELRDSTDYELNFEVPRKKRTREGADDTEDTENMEDDETEDTDTEIDMSDQKVVLTGFRDDDITDFIEDNGGKVTSSVSKNTTLVVYVETPKVSSKLQKAMDLGITTMTKDEFIDRYKL